MLRKTFPSNNVNLPLNYVEIEAKGIEMKATPKFIHFQSAVEMTGLWNEDMYVCYDVYEFIAFTSLSKENSIDVD